MELVLTLEIENIGGPVVEETLAVNVTYRTVGLEDSLVLSIPAADEIEHEFRALVPPGAVRFDIEILGESFPFDTVAGSADLEIVETEWEVVGDGRIAVDVTVRNTGNLDAEGILVVGSAVLADGAATEGSGQADSIPAGAQRTIEVLMELPAGEYVVRLQLLTASIEADVDDNTGAVNADVEYVDIGYDYRFTPAGYWSDGTANVEVAVTASNSGIGAFTDVAEVSYSCTGADARDNVSTGKFEFALTDGFSSRTHRVTLRSSPGTIECRFISQEQGSETYVHEVAAKIVGVKREVWQCYRDSKINRQDDIGCAGRDDKRVVKWDLDRPLRVWSTGDPDYIDVLWEVLDKLSPVLNMTFTNTRSKDDADLEAWVGITSDEGPEPWRMGVCADADGCGYASWDDDNSVTGGTIAVWKVDSEWIQQVGLVDRRIEHVTLHELLHALVPMGHRDDPSSAVNNINAPDWLELDPLEEAMFRFHRHPLIETGMTMAQVQELVVLEDELIDAPADRDESPTPIKLLREAFSTLQNADSATWRLEGGWSENCAEHSFSRADYTIAGFRALGSNVARFIDDSDWIYHFFDDDWSRDSGVWVKDSPDIWDATNWSPQLADIHVLLVSGFYFASDRDIRVESAVRGETTLRFALDNTTLSKADWYRSVRLEGQVSIDDRTLEITAYEMDWHFNTVNDNSCDRYEVRATQGQYGVRFDVPDVVYFGTTDDMREAIDRVNGPR